jgi:hypothetical protein
MKRPGGRHSGRVTASLALSGTNFDRCRVDASRVFVTDRWPTAALLVRVASCAQ